MEEKKVKGFSPYLSNKNRIRPAIPNRHILRRPIQNLHTLKTSLDQNLAHIGMRLDSNDLKPFLASSQSFRELASPSSQINDARTALAGHATLLEEMLDGLRWVGGRRRRWSWRSLFVRWG
jgi:hypothetical protein